MAQEITSSLDGIKKKLLKQSLGSAVVAYPAALTTLGVVAGGLFGFTNVITGLIALGVSVSVGGFTTLFALKRNENIKKIMSQITQEMEQRRELIVKDLKDNIAQFKLRKAEIQLESFQSHFATFVDVLDDRFNPSELTFLRYMNVAEQVYLSGMDNLRDAVISHKAISATNINELELRLDNNQLHAEERDALQKRVEGYNNTFKQIDELMLMNEKALSTLDQVTHKLAKTHTNANMAESDTESAIDELQRLGNMLSQYSQR
jgi:hypothetical protein